MLFSLKDKTAIVTGGASGIGLAISKLFAQQGAIVHILELNYQQAEKEVEAIRASGGMVSTMVLPGPSRNREAKLRSSSLPATLPLLGIRIIATRRITLVVLEIFISPLPFGFSPDYP